MDGFERRGEPGGPRWLVATPLGARGVLAAFTERTGGTSAEPCASLNLALHVGDDPADVRSNRTATASLLGTPAFATAEQIHGAGIEEVDAPVADLGAPGLPGCDALTTVGPRIALAILTADCVPLALTDGFRVAAVHVGWRGASAGIVRDAVAAFPDAGTVTAAVGPAIRACHYEVGEEVLEGVAAGLGLDPVHERREGSAYLDLPATVGAALRALGVGEVHECGLCTACEADRFFSYRRDGRTGRQGLIAMRR